MERYPFEEFTRVIWVPGWSSIVNMAGPTVAALGTGTDISPFLTKDGLNPGGTNNKVDGAGLTTRVDSQTAGSVGYDFTIRGFRDKEAGGDTLWGLAVWATEGFIVIRRGIAYETAIAALQDVEVYKAQMQEPTMAASAANTNQIFDLPFAIDDAELKAVVAA